jgi:hypothetical protein
LIFLVPTHKKKKNTNAHSRPAGERPALFDTVIELAWGGRCARTGTLLRLRLTTWDVTRPAGLDNAVLLCSAEARAHETRESIEQVPPDLRRVCEERLAVARAILSGRGIQQS